MTEPALFLIGPRGAGKSTLGALLAQEWGWAFVDADRLLEERHGRRILEWLPADPGGFRDAERHLLEQDLRARTRTVVALGGGIVEDERTRSFLASWPRVLALRASPAELVRRLKGGGRPPLTDLPPAEEVALVLARREALYAEAAGGRWVATDGAWEEALRRLRAAAIGLCRTKA